MKRKLRNNNCLTILTTEREIKNIILKKCEKSEAVSPLAAYFTGLKGIGERVISFSRLKEFGRFSRSNRLSYNAQNSYINSDGYCKYN